MDNSIYEVTRDEYVGFIGQLNKSMMDIETLYQEDLTIIKIHSKTSGEHLCTRIITEADGEHYFIFKMPLAEERVAPKPVVKISLENKEEVQTFFNILTKIQQEAKTDD